MEISTAENILSKMDKETFWRFSKKLFEPRYEEFQDIDWLSVPAARGLMREGAFGFYQCVYLLDYFPQQIFTELSKVKIDSDKLEESLNLLSEYFQNSRLKSKGDFYWFWDAADLEDIYFINNVKEFKYDVYKQYIEPQYEKIIKQIFPNTFVGFGTIDTFLTNNSDIVLKELEKFLFDSPDGIVFEITKDFISVNEFYLQDIVGSGVTRQTLTPLQSIVKINKKKGIIKEFQQIWESENEKLTKEFVKDNFKFIFGNKYDRIETELWLKFPHLDMNNKDRFIDIFLRNAISNDWELYELKKDLKITTHYRDLDTFTSVVYKSIEQVRNYADLLNQDEAKKKFASEGIEYCVPTLNLIIGRTPQINHNSFRKLIERNSKEVKIITYDNLVKEMNYRIEDYEDIFN